VPIKVILSIKWIPAIKRLRWGSGWNALVGTVADLHANESIKLMNVQSRAVPPALAASPLTLTEQVLERLRNDIVCGKLAASEKLRVQELSRRYGVGASPLREALSRLTADGLVVSESNRGFRVAPMSADDFMDVVANRRRLESIALEQSIRAGNGHGRAALSSPIISFRSLRRPTSPIQSSTILAGNGKSGIAPFTSH
jgi:DNA-binding transcriptional regulator YhcF (GntR family)